eukprot:TRINITY_DN871_c0_g1_i1.p2 TRINITY_DN871_c0_g1~~TRINITY_DN871_c0_g1_i1.p2  ORF type:complete len:110 (+),score=20.38 TRINITY_DN871_c0_g1_i1:76-405(+)
MLNTIGTGWSLIGLIVGTALVAYKISYKKYMTLQANRAAPPTEAKQAPEEVVVVEPVEAPKKRESFQKDIREIEKEYIARKKQEEIQKKAMLEAEKANAKKASLPIEVN